MIDSGTTFITGLVISGATLTRVGVIVLFKHTQKPCEDISPGENLFPWCLKFTQCVLFPSYRQKFNLHIACIDYVHVGLVLTIIGIVDSYYLWRY